MSISQRQGKNLGLRPKSRLSPVLEKSALRLCAQSSYGQAEENCRVILGINLGHSVLQRLVQSVEIPNLGKTQTVESITIDGGKVRVQSQATKSGEWRDYKSVCLSDQGGAAFFQTPEVLQQWSENLNLSPILTVLGDGHPGVWNVAKSFGGASVVLQRQVLDWYHLKENLYGVGGSLKRLKEMETLLWHGQVVAVLDILDGLRKKAFKRFRGYLSRHQQRIPNYAQYQRLGIPIGSGSVESLIKQIGARVKVAGAVWKPENVSQILRLRCAYLNNAPRLSISA